MNRLGIPWPRYPSGQPILKDDEFKTMAMTYPAVVPIRELRALLGKMRLIGLEVDPAAGRNHFLVSPFKSATGRNQPSNTKSVFGPSVWLRHLIVPQPGTVLLYCDWSCQEYVIAAALSGDERMLEDCAPGRDPYIRFGQHGGLLPEGASKTDPSAAAGPTEGSGPGHPLRPDRSLARAAYGHPGPRGATAAGPARTALSDVLELAAGLCARRPGGGAGLDQAGLANGGQRTDPHHQPNELADAEPRQRDAADRDGDGDGGRHPHLRPGPRCPTGRGTRGGSGGSGGSDARDHDQGERDADRGSRARSTLSPSGPASATWTIAGVEMWERVMRALTEAETAATGNLTQVLNPVREVPAEELVEG